MIAAEDDVLLIVEKVAIADFTVAQLPINVFQLFGKGRNTNVGVRVRAQSRAETARLLVRIVLELNSH